MHENLRDYLRFYFGDGLTGEEGIERERRRRRRRRRDAYSFEKSVALSL